MSSEEIVGELRELLREVGGEADRVLLHHILVLDWQIRNTATTASAGSDYLAALSESLNALRATKATLEERRNNNFNLPPVPTFNSTSERRRIIPHAPPAHTEPPDNSPLLVRLEEAASALAALARPIAGGKEGKGEDAHDVNKADKDEGDDSLSLDSEALSHHLDDLLSTPLNLMRRQHHRAGGSSRASAGCTSVLLSLLLDPLSMGGQAGGGDVYEGERDEQTRPHGKGCLRRTDGSVYTGDWFRGEATGRGVIRFPEDDEEGCSCVYDGEVLLMQPQGRGRAVYSLAAKEKSTTWEYEGEWASGLAHGRGAVSCGGDVVFVGVFRGSRALV